jgi:hypothetical protein
MFELAQFVKLKIDELHRRISQAEANRLQELSMLLLADLKDIGDVQSMSIVFDGLEALFFRSKSEDGSISLTITLLKRYDSTFVHHFTIKMGETRQVLEVR